jgi:hypothetical protein
MTARRILFINPPVLAVDAHQACMYAETVPFGLVQIATYLHEQGATIDWLDMMAHPDGDFAGAIKAASLWGLKPAGDNRSTTERRVYLYGQSFAWLDRQLGKLSVPDEVFVTCSISFNYEPAYEVVRRCKQHFPRSVVRLGGPHPTSFPEHAATSGADEVFVGRYAAAAEHFPDLDVLPERPSIWFFRLVSGCRYRCSFCANATHGTRAVYDPWQVAAEIGRVHRRYGVTSFSNWDPNVMLEPETLEAFLDAMAGLAVPVTLKFEMGVQPDRLTPALASKMWRAGTRAMTIPFESSEPGMLRRFGKPYSVEDSMRAVRLSRELGFDTKRFHCTWVLGLRDESLRHVFRTYVAILGAGGLPTPFPLTLVPGTREAELHRAQIEGKDLSELNGHLWPALASLEQVQLYDLMLRIVSQPEIAGAASLARELPPQAAAAFDEACAWGETQRGRY